ncbi:zinc-ribbon domain-containing protein [Desulfovibrio sp. JC010]|uniref:zinc-ribbon domain-containing protein n=1 Tax=Desulfovibrio sp. JC010 TaxID=2593641 RepID=UPI0013D48E1E|nr:zinc-ribbon domain-containing protein [Desulfovibrio sp. JC010]NDV25652.1 zinc-ribbon domain-containing protein [Desulfovibrio sp. JC010]
MITCTKCGKKNDDAAKACSKCGYKLQSGRKRLESNVAAQDRRDMFRLKLEKEQRFAKHGEAWIYALFLLGAVIFFTYNKVYWPLYGLTPAVALLAWFRKI